MGKLSSIGRIFYGLSIAVMGLLTIYYKNFPYFLIPPHAWMKGHAIFAYVCGALLVLAGGCIVFEKKILPASLLLGTVLLLIFCFYFIPYELLVSPDYLHFGDWENAAKELSLSGGAFVIAGCFSKPKLMRLGTILYALTIISFAIDHYLFAQEASDYIPAWVPYHLFWMYFTGTALLGAGIAILFKIRPGLFAALLGSMILIWFIILHIPRVIASPAAYWGSEVASAFLALAYCGIAYVIAGTAKK
jgi:hypothetical protein